MVNLEYRRHLIFVSVIFDTPNQYQYTPVVEIRRGDSAGVLNTILTDHAFILQEKAIDLGFKLGREWIDKQLLESVESGSTVGIARQHPMARVLHALQLSCRITKVADHPGDGSKKR